MSVDWKNLTTEQETIMERIWAICRYFEAMRNSSGTDAALAQQAKNIGYMMGDFEKAAAKIPRSPSSNG